MPHFRSRHLTPLLKKTLAYSGITGLFGHRQVGKTTLVSQFGKSYVTLDDPLFLAQATDDPMEFLRKRPTINSSGPFIIDECQLAPPLFPALKEWIRLNSHPGQFLLTGSVRFSSRRAIRESLTGRIITWELLPMDLSESHGKPLPNKIPLLLKAPTLELPLKDHGYYSETQRLKALNHGGLPGIFAVRDPAIRAQRFETMIQTLLERDLQLIVQTTLSFSSLRHLLTMLAMSQGEPLQWAALSRQTRVSIPSLKKLVAAFEAMFVVRMVRTEGTEKKSVLFFEDQGEASYLASGRYDEGTQLLRFLYSELRHQIHYRPELGAEIFQFRNRGGAYVPLCFRAGQSVLGVIPTLTETPHPSSFATARSFLKTYPRAKLLYIHTGDGDRLIDSKTRCLGVRYLL